MRERLSKLFEAAEHDERRIAWESRGVWEDDQIEEFAAEHGVTVVRDVTRAEPPLGDCVYTRLLALGDGAQVALQRRHAHCRGDRPIAKKRSS